MSSIRYMYGEELVVSKQQKSKSSTCDLLTRVYICTIAIYQYYNNNYHYHDDDYHY